MDPHRTTLSRTISAHLDRVDRTLADLQGYDDQASRLAELGSIATLLAHEINNQMTRAQAHTQLALRNQHAPHLSDPTAPYETLDQLLTIIKRTAQLTESMMRHAQPAPALQSEPISCDIQGTHASACAFLAPTSPDSSPIEYSLSCNTQGTEPLIDAATLEQVLINLYMNAEHAISTRRNEDPDAPGMILVNATLECSTWNTPRIRITIQDSGPGIEPEALPTLFQPWSSGGSPLSTTTPGHGLGLAVCEKLIAEANGTIQCSSTPGIGTTFTIVLPASQADETSDGVRSQAA